MFVLLRRLPPVGVRPVWLGHTRAVPRSQQSRSATCAGSCPPGFMLPPDRLITTRLAKLPAFNAYMEHSRVGSAPPSSI